MIQPVERDDAADLLLNRGFEPVDEASAREFHKAEFYTKYGEDNPLEAVTTGLTRGLTGGLEDFGMSPDEAKLRQATIDAHPWLGGGAEVASTLVGLGKFSKLAALTPVGLLDAAGQGVTAAARKAVSPTSVTRALGVATEGAGYAGIQAAREAHMYEQPLTVQQVASNMLGGAIIGGAIGGPIGLLERRGASIGRRLAADQEKRITAALRPGLDDNELAAILKAEGIDVTPSSLKVFQAGLYNDKDITPELLKLASDSGPVGQALRARLGSAGADRAAAEKRLADALQAQHERDDVLREHYGGRAKKEYFEKLIDDSDASTMEQVLQATDAPAIEEVAKHIARAPDDVRTAAARAFGVSEAELGNKVRVGLASQDPSVQKAVADVLKEHPLRTVVPPGATRPIIANEGEEAVVTKLGGDKTMVGEPTLIDQETTAATRIEEPTSIDRDTMVDSGLARGAAREEAGLPSGFLQLQQVQEVYPGIAEHAAEIVRRLGTGKPAWRELSSQYPALESGEAFRILAAAKEQLEQGGMGFGRVDGKPLPRDPLPAAAPEAPRPTKVPMWRHEAVKALDDARESLNFLTAMPKGYVADKKFGDVKKMLELLQGAEAMIRSGRKLDAFSELDYVKKRLGQVARPGQVLPAGAFPAQKAREAYERIRLVLEDEGLWGRAGTAQRQFNERLHRRLARVPEYNGRFLRDAGVPHSRDPWRNAQRVDLAAVRKFVDEASEDAGAPLLKGVAEHIDEGSEINKLMREYFDLEPGAKAAVDAAEAAGTEARAALKEALDAAKRERQMAKLQGRHGPSYGSRGLLWAVLGGAPGAAAAQVADQVMNPGRSIYWRGVLERFANTTENRTMGSIARVLAKGPAGLAGAVSVPAGGVARATPKIKHIFDDVMSEDYLDRVRAYNATVKELAGVASNPERLSSELQERLGDTMIAAPRLLPQLAQHSQKVAQALLNRAPVQPSNEFWGEDVAPVSDTQMQDFFRAYEIATDPNKLLEMMETGELMPGDIDVAKEAAPELVAWLQQKVVQSMAGQKVAYETRIQVSILLDEPLDPTMNPDFIGSQQKLHAARFEQKAPRRSPSTFEPTGLQAQYRSETDKIEAGEPPR